MSPFIYKDMLYRYFKNIPHRRKISENKYKTSMVLSMEYDFFPPLNYFNF